MVGAPKSRVCRSFAWNSARGTFAGRLTESLIIWRLGVCAEDFCGIRTQKAGSRSILNQRTTFNSLWILLSRRRQELVDDNVEVAIRTMRFWISSEIGGPPGPGTEIERQ